MHKLYQQFLVSLRNEEGERGQSLSESAIFLLLVVIVAIGILTTMGGQISDIFSQVSAALGG